MKNSNNLAGIPVQMATRMATQHSIGIETKGNRYRLRLPRCVANGSSRYISTSLEATPVNLRRCQRVAMDIEDDLLQGTFDTTLERYKMMFRNKLQVVSAAPQVPDLLTIWEHYVDYKRSSLSETTLQKDYLKKYPNRIKKLPTQDPRQSKQIIAALTEQFSQDAAKRTLQYLSAALDHAVAIGLVDQNYLEGAGDKLKRYRHGTDIDPFTALERDAILTAFRDDPTYRYYWGFVAFLFYTGCRPSEAIALPWDRVDLDRGVIEFRYSYDTGLKLLKGTKTGKPRKFPVNDQLRSVLLDPSVSQSSHLVFPSKSGDYLNLSKFTMQVWAGTGKKYRGVMPALIEQKQVIRYRPPYNARHTFISLMLEQGLTVPQVAKLVGNSPEVVLRHYAGNVLSMELPTI